VLVRRVEGERHVERLEGALELGGAEERVRAGGVRGGEVGGEGEGLLRDLEGRLGLSEEGEEAGLEAERLDEARRGARRGLDVGERGARLPELLEGDGAEVAREERARLALERAREAVGGRGEVERRPGGEA